MVEESQSSSEISVLHKFTLEWQKCKEVTRSCTLYIQRLLAKGVGNINSRRFEGMSSPACLLFPLCSNFVGTFSITF